MSTISPFTFTTVLLFSVAPAFGLLDYGLSHDQLALVRQQLNTFAQARYLLLISMLFSSPNPCLVLPSGARICCLRAHAKRAR
jgi:hypothetical protein